VFVIIDVQEDYRDEIESNIKKFRRFTQKLADKAVEIKRCNRPVFNLMTYYEGSPLPEVLNLFYRYKRFFNCLKEDWDGSMELMNECKRLNVQEQPIEIAGLYKEVCVLSTWEGLTRLGKKVLPVDDDLVFPAPTNLRKITEFPDGFERKNAKKRKSS